MAQGDVGLVADIGGTNARFASVGEGGALRATWSCEIANYPSPRAALAHFLNLEGGAPSHAVLAVAGPILGDRFHFTNYPQWSFSQEQLRRELRLESLRLVNDFAANAYGVPCLAPDALRKIGGGQRQEDAPLVVLGPGSGMGVSALVPAPGGAVALASEGGHATLAAANAQEAALLAQLRTRFEHVSAERLLSGPGLLNIYEAICALAGAAPALSAQKQISLAAVQRSDPFAQQALEMFVVLLGRYAGDLALIFGARGGVFIAGGIAPGLVDYLATSTFREAFEAKGRFTDYVAAVPTFVILHHAPALIGAASLLPGGFHSRS